MRTIAVLVITAFLAACSDRTTSASSEKPNSSVAPVSMSANNPYSAPKVAATSQANGYRIGKSSFELSFNDFLSRFSYDSTKESEGYLLAIKSGKPLFGLSDKNDLQDKKVRMIELYSPDILTENGVHVGMTVKDLTQIFPDLALDFRDQTDEEYFELPVSSRQFPINGKADGVMMAHVVSSNGKRLVTVEMKEGAPFPYPTKDYLKEGAVSHILMFGPGNL